MFLEEVFPKLRQGLRVSHKSFMTEGTEQTPPRVNSYIQRFEILFPGQEPRSVLLIIHEGGGISSWSIGNMPLNQQEDANWFVLDEEKKAKK
jgi:hypothetical protein